MGIMPRPMRLTRIDVHQHLWPEPFLAALEDRTEPPFLRDGVLVLEGEPAARFEAGPHDPDRRRAELRADGIDRALVALSSPLGIEALPRAEAQPLLAAWHDGVFALGEPFGVWGAVARDGASARDVEALLDRGAVGVSLPAGAFVTARGVEAVLPLLHALAARGRPLLIHPGAAPLGTPAEPWWPGGRRVRRRASRRMARLRGPGAAASRHAARRVRRPGRRGAAPRGAPRRPRRPRARGVRPARVLRHVVLRAAGDRGRRRVVGIDQLVHGSDRPVLGAPPEHGLGAAGDHALRAANPARLLTGEPVALEVAA